MATIDIVRKELERMRSSVKREAATENRKLTLSLALEMIGEYVTQSKPLPEGTNYTSYDEWKEDVNKDIKGAESSLKTIAENKELIIALAAYAEANGGEEPAV